MISSAAYGGPIPINLFTVNDEIDAAKALRYIRRRIAASAASTINAPKAIVVFGDTLDAYACINVMLECGVDGGDVVHVIPPSTSGISCFNNPEVESAVDEALKAKGVIVRRDAVLASWRVRGGGGDGARGGVMTSISFDCGEEKLEMNCMAAFCYAYKGVDLTAFKVGSYKW